MEHDEHVQLIRDGIAGTSWAELGSGRGAFTLALAEILGVECRIYSVDRDPSALQKQQQLMQKRFPQKRFPQIEVHYIHADFTRSLDLPRLDGVLMANSLHFVPYEQQVALIKRIKQFLHLTGRLVMVEYDTDRGNMWVPYPFSCERWKKMTAQAGFEKTRQLAYRRGSFLNGIYAAVSVLESDPE